MSKNKDKTIIKLEETLLKAKYRDPTQYHTYEDESIVIDAFNAMGEIEKNGYIELLKYLYDFLEDPDEYLRAQAVSSFGGFTKLEVPEFRNKAFDIWNNQSEDNYVRFVALGVWSGFYRDSCDKEVLVTLYNFLCDKTNETDLRIQALATIYEASGTMTHEIGKWVLRSLGNDELSDPNVFNETVNWDQINEIMKKHCR